VPHHFQILMLKRQSMRRGGVSSNPDSEKYVHHNHLLEGILDSIRTDDELRPLGGIPNPPQPPHKVVNNINPQQEGAMMNDPRSEDYLNFFESFFCHLRSIHFKRRQDIEDHLYHNHLDVFESILDYIGDCSDWIPNPSPIQIRKTGQNFENIVAHYEADMENHIFVDVVGAFNSLYDENHRVMSTEMSHRNTISASITVTFMLVKNINDPAEIPCFW
jgi:hypothetical protein